MNSILAQSDDAIKLTRAEKAESYPTTFGSRYFVSPSAIPQEKGKFSLHSTEVVALSASYGLTKNVSLGAGFNVFSLFDEYTPVLPFLTAKTGFKVAPNLYVGGGFFAIYDDYDGIELIGFGMITLGDRNTNITLTSSYDFIEGGITYADAFRVISPLSISGMLRVNKFISLVSENHFISNSNENLFNFMSAQGIRLIFKKNAIDLGVIVFGDDEYYFGDRSRNRGFNFSFFPFLGYTLSF